MHRILLVEDDSLNRLLLEDYLQRQGYEVLSLVDGTEFFHTLEVFQPHLVLLELKLPGIDGFSLLQELKDHSYSAVPVIALSVYAFEPEQQQAFALGVKQYLIKPASLEAIGQALEVVLSTLP